MLLAVNVVALVGGSIIPSLMSLAGLLVFFSKPFVTGAIKMGAVNTVPVSFIFFQTAIVNITISMNKPAFAGLFAIDPVTFVQSTIRQNLDSSSLSRLSSDNPLTIVFSA
jgi:hypothetical protein